MAPILSVIVIPFAGKSSLVRCLRALSRQIGGPPIEIIVPCDDKLGDVTEVSEHYPAVHFMVFHGQHTYAELRALGVQKAHGEIIALTEDHCTPNPDWCAEIQKAHAGKHVAVGGAVEKGTPDTTLGWGLYLADYVRYMNPMPEGPSSHLTDCNVSYKRKHLQAIVDVWKNEFHEPDVHDALLARGESLWFSPRIIVHQQRSVCLADALKDRFSFGRLFGSGRVSSASMIRRLMLAFLAILLPPLLTFRVTNNVFRKRRFFVPFFRALPGLILFSIAWACGESVGYFTGRPGASLRPAGVRLEGNSQGIQL